MESLEKLFSPIKIGSMELKNRIVMAPMATDFGNADGTISKKLREYHEARARGGVAMVTLEVTTIDGQSPYVPHTPGLWDDKLIPNLREFTDAIHVHGARVVPQVCHPGPESLSPFFHKIQTVGPSEIMCHSTKQMCREIAIEEIKRVVEQFGEAARRAREAGFDGVELHAAHSYQLVGSFLSALRNRRTDEYGGSIEGRLKFPIEVIKSMKAKAGQDFPIIIRLSGDELIPGGRDIRGTQYIVPILAEAGVDAFHISSGVFPQMSWRILPPTGTPLGLNVEYSAAVKQVTDRPVAVVGRINDPRFAEDVLQRNEADLIVMGRALLSDPDLPQKAMEGRFDDIAPCIGCGLGCVAGRETRAMTCVINPAVGRETEMAITPAAKPKKVMVVGAGPGGLEAARVAAIRGHEVTLYEKEAVPGGQFNLASVPPLKQELSKLIKYLRIQVDKAGVKVQLNTEVTPDLVEKAEPDVVVVATGGESLVVNLPGIDGPNVISGHDVLSGKAVVRCGTDVVVIGGGMVGLEVADYLGNPGDNPIIGCINVTVIEMLSHVGMDMAPEGRTLLMQRLRENGVSILTSATVKEILEDGVVIDRDGQEVAIRGMNRIVLCMGAKSVDVLSDKIRDKVAEVYVIGDAKQARKAVEAIAEGAEVGRQI